MSRVAIIRCEDYEYDHVKAGVQKGISLLGGAGLFVKPNEKILLKPNWIKAVPPEKCATTHPAVLKAVAEIFQAAGAILSYGDSSGMGSPQNAAVKTGSAAALKDLGVPLADFTGCKEMYFEQAKQNKRFTFVNAVYENDSLISISKLKTHGFLKLTGAIKNQFGCVPGMLKPEYHVKLTDPADFARMLVDINLCLKPRLYVMDGIMAMEGNGPMNGKPKKMNLLLFSSDPVALDAVVCRIIGVDPKNSLTVSVGKESGLGVFAENEIELAGDPLASFIIPDFDVDRGQIRSVKSGKGVMRLANNLLVPKPYIIRDKCKKCGVCVQMCPAKPKAVDWQNGNKANPPAYQYDRCIRCYCCQELCPEGAVRIKQPLVRRLVNGKR